MLEIKIKILDEIPIITLKGRFDSYGAAEFDREVSPFTEKTRHIICEMSDVDYLSSSGVRSVIKLEKALISKAGGTILVNPSAFVVKVLEISGIMDKLNCVESLEKALEEITLRMASEKTRTQKTIDGREYVIRDQSSEACIVDLWGSFADLSKKSISPEDLTGASLQEIDIAFGVGGLGNSPTQAWESIGEFISARGITGVVPADGHSISDFIVTKKASESFIYIAAAIGLSGKPSFSAQGEYCEPLSLAALLDDILQISKGIKGETPPIMGIVIYAEAEEALGSYFKTKRDIALLSTQTEMSKDPHDLFIIGILIDSDASEKSADVKIRTFKDQVRHPSLTNRGHLFHGHAIRLKGHARRYANQDLQSTIRGISNLDDLQGVCHIEQDTTIKRPLAWVYLPCTVRSGKEKRLRIDVEGKTGIPQAWEIITRQIYRDAGRVTLSALHGGYTSKAFHVTSYDMDGRRMLPTVLKIGTNEITRREEKAYHEYVEKYILNNSTTIMGTASYGEWAGLRYNFVGINGPDSRLTWLKDHYIRLPVDELVPLFDTIFTNILKPWYGQPTWDTIYPYREHNPLNMFSEIFEDAKRTLGISTEDESICCPELGMDLPNPFNILKYRYCEMKDSPRLWYKGVTHGDLNMQNILLDEVGNIYIIDFSETGLRNIVSDFARLEPILKIEMTRMETEDDLKGLLEFELGLADASSICDRPPFSYRGSDPMVEKAYKIILLLREYADRVTIFEKDIVPYLIAILEWTLPVVSYGSVSVLRKRFSAYSAAIICKRLLELE